VSGVSFLSVHCFVLAGLVLSREDLLVAWVIYLAEGRRLGAGFLLGLCVTMIPREFWVAFAHGSYYGDGKRGHILLLLL
jgi:hypothetical protein